MLLGRKESNIWGPLASHYKVVCVKVCSWWLIEENNMGESLKDCTDRRPILLSSPETELLFLIHKAIISKINLSSSGNSSDSEEC
jgi:hypothetical protein